MRLNTRLAPGVYLGLMALQRHGGEPSLVDESQVAQRSDVVDWLVHMKRLPRQRLLDQAMARGTVVSGDVGALGPLALRAVRNGERVVCGAAAGGGRVDPVIGHGVGGELVTLAS